MVLFALFLRNRTVLFALFSYKISSDEEKEGKNIEAEDKITAPCNTRLKSRAERDYSVLYYQII